MKIYLIPLLLVICSNASAELYFEFGFEGGGDTLAGTTSGQDINAGSGLKFAGGVQNQIGENGSTLSLSLGYLFDEIDAVNGSAEIDTLTFDAIYIIPKDHHRFGIGASFHIGPTYQDNIAGFSPLKLDFDDALGLVLQYSYALNRGFHFGARFTQMDYEVSGISLDADSFGIFLSNGF